MSIIMMASRFLEASSMASHAFFVPSARGTPVEVLIEYETCRNTGERQDNSGAVGNNNPLRGQGTLHYPTSACANFLLVLTQPFGMNLQSGVSSTPKSRIVRRLGVPSAHFVSAFFTVSRKPFWKKDTNKA